MNNISTKVLIVYVVTVLTIAITGSALAALSLPDGTVTANRQDSSTGSYAWFGESVTTLTMDAQNVLGVTVSGKITGISNTDTSWVEIGLIPKAIWDYWQTAYSGNFKAAVYNKGIYVVHWSDEGLALSLQEGWDDRTSTTYTTDDGPFAWPLASPTTSDPWSFAIQMYPTSSGDAYFAVAGADMYGEQPWTYGNTPSGATENDYSECYLIARIWSTTENATFSFVDTQAEILYTPTEVWVDDDYCALCDNDGHLWGYDAFDNIQDGIDAVEGSTVNVAAGTYEEQLSITKDLTLAGAGQSNTIITSPTTLDVMFTTASGGNPDRRPIVYVGSDATVTIQDLTVDGLGRGDANNQFMGISFFNAGGSVDNVHITRVRNGGLAGPLTGAQHGVSLTAFNDDGSPRSVNMTDCTIDDFQKNAVALFGPALSVNVSENVITGVGATSITAQNGIQLGSGAAGTISGNTITGIGYTGASWAASSILLFGGTGTTVSGNTITLSGSNGGDFGLNAQGGADNLTVSGNTFDGVAYGVIVLDGSGLVVTGNDMVNIYYEGIFLYGPVSGATITNNSIPGAGEAAFFVWDSDGSGTFATHTIEHNEFSGSAWANAGAIDAAFLAPPATGTLDLSANYWGSNDSAAVAATIYGTSAIDFSPILDNGDTDTGAVGFVPDLTEITVHQEGAQTSSLIQEGVDTVVGSTVNVAAGTYTESILIEKELTLLGATAGVNKNGYTVPPNYAWDDTVESIINHPDPSGGYTAIVDIHDVDNVTFDGFVVQELNAEANKNSSLIRVYAHTREISNIHVVNNVIGPNTNTTAQDGAQGRMGLYIVNHPYDDKGVVNSTFAGNKIFDCKGNGDNVFLWTSYYAYGAPGPASMAGTVIEDNEICGAHRSGIETAGGFSDLTIRNNVIYGNSGLPTDDPNFLKYGHGIQLIRGSSDKVSDPLTAYGPVNLTIEGNEIYGNEKNGIYMGPKNESITFTGNNIHDNGWDGIMLDLEGNYWNPTFEDPPISYQYACYDCSNNVVASNNAIYDNGTAGNPIANYGVQVKGVPTNGFIFDAKLNYWGAASGPYDPGGVNETNGTVCYSVDTIKNADGAGNGVSDNHVEYCPWLDTAFPDSDFDGVLDGVDNCNDTPNGPFFGTCISGDVGGNCVAHSHCGPGGVCSMDQEDNDLDGMGDVCDIDIDGDGFSNDNDICPTDYDPGQEDTCPSGGNGCGDACECEGDFDMDRDVDGTDAMAFKTDFFRKDCSSTTLCNGDFSCDGDVDGSDAVLFKADFFRKDCPDCGGWPCVYE